MRKSRTFASSIGNSLAGHGSPWAAVALFLAALFLSAIWFAPVEAQEVVAGSDGQWVLCMDLTDLEIPDETGKEYMDLPPIGEVEAPRSPPVPSGPPEKRSTEIEKQTPEPRRSSASALQPRQPAAELTVETPPVLETGRPQGAPSLKMMQGIYARPARRLD